MTETSLDPLQEALRKIDIENEKKQSEHEKLRSTESYRAEIARLDACLHTFIGTLKLCMFAATRHDLLAHHSFFLRMLDEFGASAISASFSIREGTINSARRELRYMLELAVQALYVDQNTGTATFDKRLLFFERNSNVKNSSVANIRDLSLVMLKEQQPVFHKYVVGAWAQATKYAHPTPQQITDNLALRERGIAIGFESTDQLRECINEVFRAETIVIALLFHALGPSFTGDLLVDCIDDQDGWPFHSSEFIAKIDEYFDYKFERKEKLEIIKERRLSRLKIG
ncbi:MAG TPA: hypothetical protein VMI56_26330 [Reyranella sp.]|nr:hypothetical protein [Reyranella sp.]